MAGWITFRIGLLTLAWNLVKKKRCKSHSVSLNKRAVALLIIQIACHIQFNVFNYTTKKQEYISRTFVVTVWPSNCGQLLQQTSAHLVARHCFIIQTSLTSPTDWICRHSV
jgi:hypothetical protein